MKGYPDTWAHREKRHPGTRAKGRPGVLGQTDFRAWSHRSHTRRKVARAFLSRLTLGLGLVGAVPGRKFSRAFLDRLTLGYTPVGAVTGRKFSRAFLSRLTLRPGLVGAIGLGRLARGTELEPMVPTMPSFFLSGRKIIPGRKKKDKLDRHIIETIDHQCCLIST